MEANAVPAIRLLVNTRLDIILVLLCFFVGSGVVNIFCKAVTSRMAAKDSKIRNMRVSQESFFRPLTQALTQENIIISRAANQL
jgi:hypothetical protein